MQINNKSFRFRHRFTWNLRLHEFSWGRFILRVHSDLIHERFNCATLKQTELIQGKYDQHTIIIFFDAHTNSK